MSKEFSSMNIENEQFQEPPQKPIDRRIVEYPSLVDTVQLSAARRLSLNEAFAVKSFEQLLLHKEDEEQQEIISAVGARFDEDLINFVVGSIINRSNHEMIILAKDTDGVEGHLHWEAPLLGRIALLQEHGLLHSVKVHVERYSDDYETVADLVAQKHEESAPSIHQKHDV